LSLNLLTFFCTIRNKCPEW